MNILGLARFSLVSLLAVCFFPAHALEDFGYGDKSQFVPGEIIVKMKPSMRLGPASISTFGLQTDDKLTSGGEIIYRIQPSVLAPLSATQARDRTLEVVEKLKQQAEVEYAQPNFILHILKTPNDTLYPKQWHYFNYGSAAGESLGGIDLPKAWDIGTGSDNIVVSVIDTGVLPNHEDISGSANLVPGYDMISDSAKANDGDGRDADATDAGDAMKKGECFFGLFPEKDTPSSWHGTHVAGTIGVGNTDNNLGIAGINWNVKVQAVRVLGKCGGSTTDINDGIRWAAGLSVPGVPDNTTPANVINMSLGGEQPCSDSPATQQAINDAVNAGVTVVVAAGNSNKDASGFNPAGCDNVITVAAADPRGQLAPYSNWGDEVEILAPGGWTESGCVKPEDGVLSAVQTSEDRGNCGVPTAYAYYNGTSMASPHVAGVAALWLAQNPSLTPSALAAELQSKARPRTAEQCPKPCGAGLLTAFRGTPGKTLSLEFAPDKASYKPNDTITARATLKDNNAPQAGITVTFNTDNASVASVSPETSVTNSQGVAETSLSANAAGDAMISAQAETKIVQKSIRVQADQLTVGITFDPDKPKFAPGETTQALVSVKLGNSPQNGQTVQFRTDNQSVATLSSSSAVTNAQGQANVTVMAQAAGTATISAEADGEAADKTITVPDWSFGAFLILLLMVVGIGVAQGKNQCNKKLSG